MATIQQQGEEVELQVEGTRPVIACRTPLAELLAQCRPDNQPETLDFAPPVGCETI